MPTRLDVTLNGIRIAQVVCPDLWLPHYGTNMVFKYKGKNTLFISLGHSSTELRVILKEI